ncbi:hypothetical protein ACFFLS_21560 [Flavobacterium procerum]|uniref:Uncharacterized protein n=1 Tax=Flavobacterium procerum TaxID=1455569 RepID=A0ABV6C003_9FLAO
MITKKVNCFIINRANEILNADKLTDISNKSEIKENQVIGTASEDFMNYEAFLEYQNEKRPLFSIFLGEEDMTYIRYSDKLKKVVDITGCC